MTHPDRTKDQYPSPGGQGAQPEAPGGQGTAAGPDAPPAGQVAVTAPPATTAPAPAAPAPAAPPARHHVVRRSRMGGAWVGLALGAVVLVLLLVFILENGRKVNISFFGAHGHMPLGVALLLAAALGVLLVVIPGTGRLIQLRRTARRHRKSDAKVAADPASAAPPTADSAPADGTAANHQ
jgi:uncharacterized integral membrane protein